MKKFFRPPDPFGLPLPSCSHSLAHSPTPFYSGQLLLTPLGLRGRGHFPQKAFLVSLQLVEVSLLCGSLAPYLFPVIVLTSFYCYCLLYCLTSHPNSQEGRECVFCFSLHLEGLPLTHRWGLLIVAGWTNERLRKRAALQTAEAFSWLLPRKGTNPNRNPFLMNAFPLADFQQGREFPLRHGPPVRGF